GEQGKNLPAGLVSGYLASLGGLIQFRIARKLDVPGFEIATLRETQEAHILEKLGLVSRSPLKSYEVRQKLVNSHFIGSGESYSRIFGASYGASRRDRMIIASIADPEHRIAIEKAEPPLGSDDLSSLPSPLRELYTEFKDWDGYYSDAAKKARLQT